jgi:hypothetical protein
MASRSLPPSGPPSRLGGGNNGGHWLARSRCRLGVPTGRGVEGEQATVRVSARTTAVQNLADVVNMVGVNIV